MEDEPATSKIYLIRHGETIDNVKGLYAGVRDSALTVHGVQQTRKLGQWLADNKSPLTHIFSSDLTRAHRTAEAIRDAQSNSTGLYVTQLSILQEQNFGALEGQPWTSKQQHGANSKNHTSGDSETKEAMILRANAFLDDHLQPLLQQFNPSPPHQVAIVSHGMLLSTLWKQILNRCPASSVSVEPEVLVQHQPLVLEHLGGWSNTGFLELKLVHTCQSRGTDGKGHLSQGEETDTAGCILKICVLAINERTHLLGLKRARGGIGSSAHDDHQKPITAFFKKPKIN